MQLSRSGAMERLWKWSLTILFVLALLASTGGGEFPISVRLVSLTDHIDDESYHDDGDAPPHSQFTRRVATFQLSRVPDGTKRLVGHSCGTDPHPANYSSQRYPQIYPAVRRGFTTGERFLAAQRDGTHSAHSTGLPPPAPQVS